jgi:NTP pyrophosphatase (non-canonical NTP hydrolase)
VFFYFELFDTRFFFYPDRAMKSLISKLIAFRDARDWKQFHDPKNLAIALGIEASELNELFLWKKETDLATVNQERIAEELADVMIYALLLCEHYGFDPKTIIADKIATNGKKYPVEKARGRADKYDQL